MTSTLEQMLASGRLEAGMSETGARILCSCVVHVCLKGLGCAGVSAAETKKELRKVQYTLEQVEQDSSEHFAPGQASCLMKYVVCRPLCF